MEPFCVILKFAPVGSASFAIKYWGIIAERPVTVSNAIGTPKRIDNGQLMDQLFAFRDILEQIDFLKMHIHYPRGTSQILEAN